MKIHIIVFLSAMTIGVFLSSLHLFEEKTGNNRSVQSFTDESSIAGKNKTGGFFSEHTFQLESELQKSNKKIEAMENTLNNAITTINKLGRKIEQMNAIPLFSQDNNSNPDNDYLIHEQETLEAENHDSFFDDLEDQMLHENNASVWANDMTHSLSSIAEKLEETDLNARITAQECKESTCRIEITHNEKPENIELLPVFIASAESSQVYMKQVHENGYDKTIAIYKR